MPTSNVSGRAAMSRKISLETLMKWIFLLLALSMVVLTLGARLHQSYTFKRNDAMQNAERLRRLYRTYDLVYSKEMLLNELGSYWRESGPGERPAFTLRSKEGDVGFLPDPKAIYADMVEDERYLILVAMLGLIISVELAVFLSYILTRPMRRLTWMCREISAGRSVQIPQASFSPQEFSELVDSFNHMTAQLERWREVQRQVSRMDRLAALGEMISGLSHEIRNPLASMRIQTDLLRDEIERFGEGCADAADMEEAKERIAVLGSEMDRLNGIVVQLLSFVRPQPAVMSEVALGGLLPWISSMLSAQCRKYSVELRLENAGEDIAAAGDPEALRQVMMNLALNAVQAMQDMPAERRRVLSIGVGPADDGADHEKRAVIEVADTGAGISPDIEHRIFDPFFTTRKEGTGLGLTIVQRIIAGMGGDISLESGSEGTLFRIYLRRLDEGGKKDGGRADEHLDS